MYKVYIKCTLYILFMLYKVRITCTICTLYVCIMYTFCPYYVHYILYIRSVLRTLFVYNTCTFCLYYVYFLCNKKLVASSYENVQYSFILLIALLSRRPIDINSFIRALFTIWLTRPRVPDIFFPLSSDTRESISSTTSSFTRYVL